LRYGYFTIKNFKGIELAHLDLAQPPRGRVYTLIGLNESGKTTLLEAINFLGYKSETLDPLDLAGYSVGDVHDVIPISKRANFNDKVRITAGVELAQKDQDAIDRFLKERLGARLAEPVANFTTDQKYLFVNSKLAEKQPPKVWSIKVYVKRAGKRRPVLLDGADWQKLTTYIADEHLPSILYFPNFLFEFPDRIYLDEPPADKDRHVFFRRIVQDVLDAVGGNIVWETHILARAKSGGKAERQALESVLLKMGAHITEHIFGAWSKIFRKSTTGKELVIGHDQDEAGRWYLQFRIKEANELYAISERSLGFRWFFTYLLLTYYRGLRADDEREVLFLLDEPASNLHPSAQGQLLQSFARLPANCEVIYTTHSHHLVDPNWLDNAFVVKNEGLTYGEEDRYVARNTNVVVERYRKFAATHPDQTTYFQPVLDVLDYKPGNLENIPDVVMVEGKNDFYTLKLFNKNLRFSDINLMPGGAGASGLDHVIRLYLGWGRNFLVLLDADVEGESQKKRYESLFGPALERRVVTLADVSAEWRGRGLELVLTEADRRIVQTAAYPDDTKFSKTHFNRAVQELYLRDMFPAVSDDAVTRFRTILTFLAERLKGLRTP